MQQQADEDELGLSSATLAALKEFALENDMLGELHVCCTVEAWRPSPVP